MSKTLGDPQSLWFLPQRWSSVHKALPLLLIMVIIQACLNCCLYRQAARGLMMN